MYVMRKEMKDTTNTQRKEHENEKGSDECWESRKNERYWEERDNSIASNLIMGQRLLVRRRKIKTDNIYLCWTPFLHHSLCQYQVIHLMSLLISFIWNPLVWEGYRCGEEIVIDSKKEGGKMRSGRSIWSIHHLFQWNTFIFNIGSAFQKEEINQHISFLTKYLPVPLSLSQSSATYTSRDQDPCCTHLADRRGARPLLHTSSRPWDLGCQRIIRH